MFYAALDVSLRSVAICIIDQDGKLRLERSVASEGPDLIRCLREFGEPIHQVGLEAGTLTQHLTYGLTEANGRARIAIAESCRTCRRFANQMLLVGAQGSGRDLETEHPNSCRWLLAGTSMFMR